jgi:hypothetical protein
VVPWMLALWFTSTVHSAIRYHHAHYLEEQLQGQVAVFWVLDASMMLPVDQVLRENLSLGLVLGENLTVFSKEHQKNLFSQIEWEWVDPQRVRLFEILKTKGTLLFGLSPHQKDGVFSEHRTLGFQVLRDLGVRFTQLGETDASEKKQSMLEKGVLSLRPGVDPGLSIRSEAQKLGVHRIFVISAQESLLTKIQQGLRGSQVSFEGFLLDAPLIDARPHVAQLGKRQLEHFLKTGEWQTDKMVTRIKVSEEQSLSHLRGSNRWVIPRAR